MSGRICIAHRLNFLASNGVEPGSAITLTGLLFRQEIERMPVNIVVVGGRAVIGSVKVEGWLARCLRLAVPDASGGSVRVGSHGLARAG